MRAIFSMECKKALSRKNLFVMILYTGILLVFIATNIRTFTNVRETELQRLQRWAVVTENHITVTRSTVEHFRYGTAASLGITEEMRIENLRRSINRYHTRIYIVENIRLMVDAMEANDRKAEITFFNNIRLAHLENYRYYYEVLDGSTPTWGYFARRGPDTWMDFPARFAHHEAHQAFTQHFVDNDILYIYESEMRGLNFVYQVLRQILPLAMLLIIFLSVSDVFTSDNQWGSYKFLLVNPISRTKVFFAKIAAAGAIAFVMIFAPIAVLSTTMGIINGFGPFNYPILTQSGTFSTFTPLSNNLEHDSILGNFVGYWIWLTNPEIDFVNSGTAYLMEYPALGLTPITSYRHSPNYPFSPHPDLQFTAMLQVLFMALPIYLLLILTAVAASALAAVIFQHGIPTMIMGALLGLGIVFFPAPVSDISILARINPYMYANPINILNGLGSTTALTGVVVLAGWSIVLIIVGLIVFNRRDIRC